MSEVDYYDVQAMIRDARSEIRGEIANAVAEVTREVTAAAAVRLDELRAEIATLQRVLAARTESLV